MADWGRGSRGDRYNGSGSGRYFDSNSQSGQHRRRGLEYRSRDGRRVDRVRQGGNGTEWWSRSPRRDNNTPVPKPVGSRRRYPHATQYDEMGVARKRVRGGRIAKVRKVRDPEPDLYCKACEYYLADANAKAAHDRGRIHLLKIEELRENMNKEEAVSGETEPRFDKISERNYYLEEVNDTLAKTDAELFKLYKKALHDRRKPVMYTKWCERSLKSVPRGGHASEEDYQESVRRVQREIMHVTAHLYDDGTWLLQNWESKKIASGKMYAQKRPPRPHMELVIPDCQVKEIEGSAPALMDIPIENTSVVPITPMGLIGDHQQRLEDMDVDNMNRSQNGNELANDIDVTENPPLRAVNVSWRMSECAHNMVSANMTDCPEEIISQFASAYPRDCAPKARKEESEIEHEMLIQEFRALRNQFTNEDYECSIKFDEDVNALIGRLQKSGMYRRQIQVCIDMLVKSSISSFQFGLLTRSLARLMESVGKNYIIEESHKEHVGYWVISLLMLAGQTLSREPNISLDCKLSKLPSTYLKVDTVKLGLAVLRALITNNYVAFFNLYTNHPVHLATKKRSFYIMQSFVQIVRQQALLTFGAPGPTRGTLVYQHPSVIPLTRVLADLKWTSHASGQVMWDTEEGKKQLQALGLHVKEDGDGKTIHLECSKDLVSIRNAKNHSHVDVATLFGFINRKNLALLK